LKAFLQIERKKKCERIESVMKRDKENDQQVKSMAKHKVQYRELILKREQSLKR
jgi:hypothetical protein